MEYRTVNTTAAPRGTAPVRLLTCLGARVALLRCPILPPVTPVVEANTPGSQRHITLGVRTGHFYFGQHRTFLFWFDSLRRGALPL